jgi:class 3 adenylate cyclase
MTVPCGSCGTELGATAKFCGECGTSVVCDTQSAEYKQVTVLFADVVHSMDIAAALGAERLREIMAELADRAALKVHRYGGTVAHFTGDGIMAVFGAPIALEDHAERACLAALAIQEEVRKQATTVQGRDGVDLRLRVGLNSGQVIAGEIGSSAFGYTAMGEQVGLAQRMESIAPAGGVMLSESTARLVEGAAVFGEPEMSQLKGREAPTVTRRLLGITPPERKDATRTTLVGRELELRTVVGLLERSVSGRGCVVCVEGPAGIGKTRLVDELVSLAKARGVEVVSTFCESHSTEIPFNVVTRLLRASLGIRGLADEEARSRVRSQFTDADPHDLVLLDDLLGVADPAVSLPRIDPDARRRRLTALISTALLTKVTPSVFVLEDVHWIDVISESMLADVVTVIPQTSTMVLATYRTDYEGAFARVHGVQAIGLVPLSRSESEGLIARLLGDDPSIAELAGSIAERAGGNPYFAHEIVRDLSERGVLEGQPGSYVCRIGVGVPSVPATLQAALAARIDRLAPRAKRTLTAAAVIGSRFDTELLKMLVADPMLDELVRAELIDQVRFIPRAVYAFHHSLIRTVAYDAQLKTDRAELHRRLARAIGERGAEDLDANAALIADHLGAAGDFRDAYQWHMRAGGWLAKRDIAAARLSWENARQIADALATDVADRTAMRVAPRGMLCASAWRVRARSFEQEFEELRRLCAESGDKASLAIAMAGGIMGHVAYGRVREASQMASEQMALLDSVGDSTLTIGLSFAAIIGKHAAGDVADMLRWSQAVIDLADGDPTRGDLIIGAPLAWALATRSVARWVAGLAGWREDFDEAVEMARRVDPVSHTYVVYATYGLAIPFGVLLADDHALHVINEALLNARGWADDSALLNAQMALGLALMYRDSPADRERGLEVLAQVRESSGDMTFLAPLINLYFARARADDGDLDGAVPLLRAAIEESLRTGQPGTFVLTSQVFVEALIEHGDDSYLVEAANTIERVAAAIGVGSLSTVGVIVLRLRALLAYRLGDEAAYRQHRQHHREAATSIGLEGHMQWAESMPDSIQAVGRQNP